MCIGKNSIDEALWDIESYIMNRKGVDVSHRLMSPLNWYVETGRASTQFLRWLVNVKPFVAARILMKGGTDRDVIDALKRKAGIQ